MSRTEIASRLARARAVMDCRCLKGKGPGSQEPVMFWASEFEYWNTPIKGHLIGASLILDGLPAREPGPTHTEES